MDEHTNEHQQRTDLRNLARVEKGLTEIKEGFEIICNI